VIVLLAVPFAVLFGGLFLLMFTHTSSAHQGSAVRPNTSGGWWGAFVHALTITNPIAVGIEKALGWVVRNARGIVSHWALASVKPVARWFDGVNELYRRVFTQMSGLATDTAQALHLMRHKVIPHAAKAAALPAVRQAKVATAKAEKALARERALHSTVTTQHARQVKLNVHYTHAIDAAIPQRLGRIETKQRTQTGDIAKVKDAVRGLEDGAIDTFKWLSAHRTTAAMGVFTGAVAWALSRLGYGFLRCRSWQNLGRSMKCSDANVLRDLLFAATAIAVGMDLVTLARAEQTVIKDAATVVHDLWHV